MSPEVKTIYNSMLTRKDYHNVNVSDIPEYIIQVVMEYDDYINLEFSEIKNIKNLLEIIIKKSK